MKILLTSAKLYTAVACQNETPKAIQYYYQRQGKVMSLLVSFCLQGREVFLPTGGMSLATVAAGTHPTGMYSCVWIEFSGGSRIYFGGGQGILTRSPKQWYQWPHKRADVPQKILKKQQHSTICENSPGVMDVAQHPKMTILTIILYFVSITKSLKFSLFVLFGSKDIFSIKSRKRIRKQISY